MNRNRRYVDVERIKKAITDYAKDAIDNGLMTLDPVDDIISIVRIVDCIDTSDVVPKAEFELLQQKYALAVAEREANVKGFTVELAKAKTEVERANNEKKE